MATPPTVSTAVDITREGGPDRQGDGEAYQRGEAAATPEGTGQRDDFSTRAEPPASRHGDNMDSDEHYDYRAVATTSDVVPRPDSGEEVRRAEARRPEETGDAPSPSGRSVTREPESEMGDRVSEALLPDPKRARTDDSVTGARTDESVMKEDGQRGESSGGLAGDSAEIEERQRQSVQRRRILDLGERTATAGSTSSSSWAPPEAQNVERPTSAELLPSLPEGRGRAQVQELTRWATGTERLRSPQPHSSDEYRREADFAAIADDWFEETGWSGSWSIWMNGEVDTILCPDEECHGVSRRTWIGGSQTYVAKN